MPQLVVHRPFDERHLDDDLRADPVGAEARYPRGFRERRLRDLERIQARAKVEQQPGIEAGADLAGKHEVVALDVPDEQRTEADTSALRIGEAADRQLLGGFALHLEPALRAAVLVDRAESLRDHTFPAFAARALPRLRIVKWRHAFDR